MPVFLFIPYLYRITLELYPYRFAIFGPVYRTWNPVKSLMIAVLFLPLPTTFFGFRSHLYSLWLCLYLLRHFPFNVRIASHTSTGWTFALNAHSILGIGAHSMIHYFVLSTQQFCFQVCTLCKMDRSVSMFDVHNVMCFQYAVPLTHVCITSKPRHISTLAHNMLNL